jgi:hypothetical protein
MATPKDVHQENEMNSGCSPSSHQNCVDQEHDHVEHRISKSSIVSAVLNEVEIKNELNSWFALLQHQPTVHAANHTTHLSKDQINACHAITLGSSRLEPCSKQQHLLSNNTRLPAWTNPFKPCACSGSVW